MVDLGLQDPKSTWGERIGPGGCPRGLGGGIFFLSVLNFTTKAIKVAHPHAYSSEGMNRNVLFRMPHKYLLVSSLLIVPISRAHAPPFGVLHCRWRPHAHRTVTNPLTLKTLTSLNQESRPFS